VLLPAPGLPITMAFFIVPPKKKAALPGQSGR